MGHYKDKSNAGVYGDSSIRSSTRFILRNAWNSNNIVGVNNKKRAIGSFRATLNAGDLLVLPRNYFRSTKVFQEGAIFLESIEGPYFKEKRIKLNYQ